MKKVADIMSLNLITLSPEHLCYHALLKMQEYQLHHIPLVDATGTLVGIVSDRDLKQQLQDSFQLDNVDQTDMEWMLKPLSEIMSYPTVTVTPDESVLHVLEMMLSQKISSVMVLPEGSQIPAGIVTETDLLYLLRSLLREE